MRFVHVKCGGEIDVEKRTCLRCKKKWSRVAFRYDPTGIRPMVDAKGKLVPDKVSPKALREKTYHGQKTVSPPGWVDRVPLWADLGLTGLFVKKLPRWPRWARILTTLIFVGVVITIILALRRC